jgi:GGDEF domain-containing protein
VGDRELQQALAGDEPSAIAMLDFDDFKEFVVPVAVSDHAAQVSRA